MYLAHFGFQLAPFSQTPNTELFLALPPHYEALQTVLGALAMGEGMIKLTGEVGTGKTMLCRMLIAQLEQPSNDLSDTTLVYLPNPVLTGAQLQRAVARELALNSDDDVSVVSDIQDELIRLRQQGRKTVLLVDEAQALSDEALETLRLLGNLETEQEKLLQMVLIGQPELDMRLQAHHLRQLRQRISFMATLRPLNRAETELYIEKRISQAGAVRPLLSLAQKRAIWRASQGIPRLINQLCHKALILAWHQGQGKISNYHLWTAMQETYDVAKPRFYTPRLWSWSR
ncbi:AAA family ATPase [Vibrio sp. SM6]|uniref:AAA family ATPase n=1 Tax=Vibrio agarilyticus TaxID=2726741 RepID=A0A7X8TU73_9VIBR|nr:AAA family ATPase [Vibrio agarilyticus]NLS14597.1 AAA family ATPase [Vibrio agarilyticus]